MPEPETRNPKPDAASPAPDRTWARRDWLALAFLAALAFGFHGRFLLTGEMRLGCDLTGLQEPLRTTYVSALRAGHLAVWWPNQNLGTPLLAESQLGQLHPFNLLLFSLLPAREGTIVWNAVLVFLAGAFMYLFGREIGLGLWGRALSAVTFMLGGFYISHVNHAYAFFLQGAHFPLVLLLAERTATGGRSGSGKMGSDPDEKTSKGQTPFSQTPSGRGRWAPWWIALVVGLAVLAGHYQLTFQALLLYGFYGTWRAAQVAGLTLRGRRRGAGENGVRPQRPAIKDFAVRGSDPIFPGPAAQVAEAWRAWFGRMAWLGAPLIFAAGLSAMQWMPTLELTQHFDPHRWASGHLKEGILPPLQLLAYVSPYLFRIETGPWMTYWDTLYSNFWETLTYVGILPLGFIAVAWSRRKTAPAVWPLAAGAVFFTVLSATYLRHVPGFGYFRASGRYFFGVSFCLAALAGIGLERALGERGPAALRRARMFLTFVAWMSVIALATAGVLTVMIYEGYLGGLAGTAARWSWGLPAAAASVVAFWWVAKGKRHAGAVALVVTAADLLAVSFGCETFRLSIVPRRAAAGTSAVVRRLPPPEKAGRVCCLGQTWPLDPRYDFIFLVVPNVPHEQVWLLDQSGKSYAESARLLNACGVRFIITDQPIRDTRVRCLYDGDDPQTQLIHGRLAPKRVYLYERNDWLPRAYLADRAMWLDDWDGTAEVMTRGRYDMRRTVLLDGPGPAAEDPPPPAGDPGTCTIVKSHATRVAIDVQANRDAWLVLGDLWYPGWDARLDEREDLKVERANGLMRAVRVPAGRHTVTFDFHPRSLWLGLWVSGASGLALLLTAAAWAIVGRVRITSPSGRPAGYGRHPPAGG